jgi:alkanesulfonate monooxygenase SsuD/methylene tetrahydromethanopterin reductase-like flavin-dependent oxidoreductase (luciferase family)
VKTTALPLDRLLLGVGSPNPDSLKRVRAGIAELRANLSTRLIVAALGPQMCRLAGEVADGVLFNWLTPEYARMSAERVREGAAAARRQPPKLYAYLRVALGPTARDLLEQEANRYAGVPAYAANFTRMGLKPVETAIAAQNRDDVQRGLAPWSGVVDHIIVRSITAKDTVDEHVALVKAAAPA